MEIQIDKVSRGRSRRAGKGAGAAKARKSKAAGRTESGRTFDRNLLETQRTNIREELDQLLVRIDDQASEIEKSLTFESLEAYRELVRKFVGIVVNELFVVEEKLSVSPTGKKKSLLLVKTIDEELESLAREFINRQGNLIAFMARLDKIRGLLLDLYS